MYLLVISGCTIHVLEKQMDDLFKDLPLWFKVGWVFAWGVSLGLSLVIMWAIIQVVLWLIG